MIVVQDSSERIGKLTFTVRSAAPSPESQARWNNRADALANLLVSMWEEQEQLQREQLAAIAARN